MAQVKLQVQMDNDAMRTGSDLAAVLRDLAQWAEEYGNQTLRHPWTPPRVVRDVNGNVVGKLRVTR